MIIDYEPNEIKEVSIGFLKLKPSEITVDDMPTEIMRDIFELLGRDMALKLLIYMSGNIIQVPVDAWVKIKTKFILDNYDFSVSSIKYIARTINVSEKYIRDVLSRHKIKNIPTDGQLNVIEEIKKIEAGKI